MNQILIEVGQDTFEFVVPVIMMTCFFCCLMEIPKASGLLKALQNFLNPFLIRLFPDVPEDDPSLQYIGANIVINMFGLGFAATPSGLKAMEHLQKLNKDKKTASRPMITFLVLNTAGVTLVPTTVLALRDSLGSSNPADFMLIGLIGTLLSCVGGVVIERLLRRPYQ